MAKEILRRHISQNLPIPIGSFRYGFPQVLLSQLPVHSCLASNVLTYCTKTPLQYRKVSWDTFGGAITTCSPAGKKFVVTWLSQHCALGVTMRKRKARHQNRCPRCNEFIEDSVHCIRCPDREALTVWNGRKTHTARNYLCHHWRTTSWYRDPNSDVTTSPELPLSITRAIRSQNVSHIFIN